MATLKQISANRRNALKSTGPKTLHGKTVSSRNPTKHGFYATTVLLPDEDRNEFIRLGRSLVAYYAPCGVLQEELVKTIIETRWQLRRANMVDTELFQIYRFYEGEERGVGTAFAQDSVQGNAFTKSIRYHHFLLRKLQASEKQIAHLKATEGQPTPNAEHMGAVTSPELTPVTATTAPCPSPPVAQVSTTLENPGSSDRYEN